jgi:hypothetical protein
LCDCYLECGEIVYKTETERMEFIRFSGTLYLVDYADNSFMSQFLVFFKSVSFFPLILQKQLTLFDFVSYCGGSLGLFLGFSALSAVEILVHIFVRPFCRKVDNRVQDLTVTESETVEKTVTDVLGGATIHGFKNCANKSTSRLER